MANITDNNHVTIQGWMRTRLNLKGVCLIVFATVYSFSQDGESEFRGSIDYIKDIAGASRDTVMRHLKYLEDRKLVEKVDHNTEDGKTNGYIVVMETVNALVNESEGGVAKCYTPHSKMRQGVSQNATGGVAKCDTIIKNINNNITKSIEKVSKKESRKEGSYKPSACARVRESYDDIIAKYELSDEVREAVGDFIRHCVVNDKTLTNKVLYRIMDALMTYPEERRCKALQDAIDRNLYTLKPLADKHYSFTGAYDSDSDYKHVMEVSLKDYLGNNADFVFAKLWEFIQHCRANGQRITNSRLHGLCAKLKRLYRPTEASKMREALDKAISGGYYDIKDGEDWTAEQVRLNQAFGVNPLGEVCEDE